MFVLSLLVPVMLSGCGGGSETSSTESPVAAKPDDAKPEDAKAEGTVEIIDKAGLQLTVPKGWEFSTSHEEKIISIDHPDGSGLSIVVPNIKETKGSKEMLASLGDNRKEEYKNYEQGEVETETINGMEYTFFTATGNTKESSLPTVIKSGYIEGPKLVVTTIIMPKDQAEADAPIIDEILQSLEKIE